MKAKLFTMIATLLAVAPAFAQDGGTSHYGLIGIGSGLALGLAALGGALGQGKIGASAMDGIARNPQAGGQMFTPMIIALVFVETLVLFTFLVAFTLAGKIPGIDG